MLCGKKKQDRHLKYWLLGLTKKTADNLGIKAEEYPALFSKLIEDIKSYPSNIPSRDTTLLLWCGAATLTIRGSQKSKIGKALEKSIARAALSVIGLNEGEGIGEFQLNIGADKEVARETDAEIRTKRGKVRVEIGLIGVGNPEVIGDKIGRMSRNGVILFDMLPPNSTMWQYAQHAGVKLIQMRNNHPVEELRQHLAALDVPVQPQEILLPKIESQIKNMPLDYFS